ncbi:MAG: M14 family metallopeptidase [Oligoflexus sp.]
MPHRYQRSMSYAIARERFLEACHAANSELHRLRLCDFSSNKKLDPELFIDITILYPEKKVSSCLVISSGLHGVEGFAGSEVQRRFIDFLSHAKHRLAETKLVMIHAVNPYGFKYLRRWNEDGIDLNRNFLLDEESYQGSPDKYAELFRFINPSRPPQKIDRFWLEAPYQISKHGFSTMTNVIATGQYDFPDGLFFGGQAPSASMIAISQHIDQWIDANIPTLHLDLHTGLGRWGELSFFLEALDPQNDLHDVQKIFLNRTIRTEKNSAFLAQGLFGRWLLHRYFPLKYRFLTLEFGTFGMIGLFKILRSEHQAYRYLPEDHPDQIYWRQRLLDYFSPATESWWRSIVPQGVEACWQALIGLQNN